MKKTVDINKSATEKEIKDFATVCTMCEWFCIVLVACFTILMVILVIALIVAKGMTKDLFITALNGGILIFGMVSALNFGRVIFKRLKSGETPFRYDIVDKIKGASYALVISGMASIFVQSVSHFLSEFFSDISHYLFFVLVGNMFIGVLLGVVAYVMNYGCKLQQESDETL